MTGIGGHRIFKKKLKNIIKEVLRDRSNDVEKRVNKDKEKV
ncbi:MAG: hypothetical protein ACI4EJ_07740 [Bacteroides sp.]